MKKICIYIIFIIGISSIGLCETVVSLATDPFPPYIIKNRNDDDFHGIYIDILDEIFTQMDGVKYKIVHRPWNRCLKEAQFGDVDGVLMLFKTPEREKYLVYSKPMVTEIMSMWVLASKFPDGLEWDTMKDLKEFSFVYPSGYSISKEWDQAVKKGDINKAIMVYDNEVAMELVSMNRYDIAPMIERVGYEIIKKKSLERTIIQLNKPLGQAVYYIGFSKKSPQIEKIQSQIIPQINKIVIQREQ